MYDAHSLCNRLTSSESARHGRSTVTNASKAIPVECKQDHEAIQKLPLNSSDFDTRLFDVPELVESIVEHSVVRIRYPFLHIESLKSSDIAVTSWKTLKSLSLTSRIFREPCLNALWQHQTSLVLLLRTVRAIAPVDGKKKKYKCLRLLGPEDMQKMVFYSSRIRSMTFHYDITINMGEIHFHELLPPGILFPRLRSVSWGTYQACEILFILNTVGRSLTRISGKRSTVVLLRIQEALLVPSLTSLSLSREHGESTDPAFCSALLASLRISTHLRKVDVGLDKEEDVAKIWKAFTELPVLEKCTIDGISMFNMHSCVKADFLTLTCLHIDFESIAAGMALLQVSSFPCLTELWVGIETEDDNEDKAYAFSKAIASSCPSDTLVSLHFCFTPPAHYASELYGSLRCQVLRPFLRYPRIQDFYAYLPCWFLDLDDAFVSEMLHTWPALRRLRLNADPNGDLPDPGCRVTFKLLEEIAALCPQIEDVEILFNNEPGVLPISPSRLSIQNTSLKTLDVGKSLAPDVTAMATLLSGLFPSLSELKFADYVDEEGHMVWEAWNEVQNLIPAMVAIRREEREWNATRMS